MRIGILTGGGDVPGLNACIKAVTRRASELGWEVIGFRRGWAGPLHYNLDDPEGSQKHLVHLTPALVRTIDRSGGTKLHTARMHPHEVKASDVPDFLKAEFATADGSDADCTPHILRVLEHLKIDAMITIGGDGTLSFSARLHQEGVKVMSIPKTMDNDVYGTDYCIGFSTAVTRSVDALQQLRTSTGSHERIAVVEMFGRNSGETALISGYLADMDRVLIAEVPINLDKLADLIVADRAANSANYAMMVVSEGAHLEGSKALDKSIDEAGQRELGGIGAIVGNEIKRRTGIGIIGQNLGYLMRSGAPDALDVMVAKAYGTMAVQMLDEGRFGLMMALRDGNYCAVPADECIGGIKRVDVAALYDPNAYRPRIAKVEAMPMFLY